MKVTTMRVSSLAAWASGLAGVATFLVTYFSVNPDKLVFSDLPFNDLSTALVDLQVEQSRQLFELGLLFIGGLWAAVIIDGKRPLAVGAELAMFCSATVMLVMSELCHVHYLGTIYEVLHTGAVTAARSHSESIPDLFDSRIEVFYVEQLSFLFAGVVLGSLTLLTARYWREH